jgi:Xaa-Pro aminopeptidase
LNETGVSGSAAGRAAVEKGGGIAPMEVSSRLERLAASFEEAGIDCMLVTSLTNVRYLTGFTGSAAMLLALPPARGRSVLVTDGRYATQAPEEVEASGVGVEVVVGTVPSQLAALVEAATGSERVGFEARDVSYSLHAKLCSDDLFGSGRLQPQQSLVESLREVKDQGELARIAKAAAIADAALGSLLTRWEEWIAAGDVSEADVACELDFAMRRGGASESAFETIVASGANAAKPHHRAGDGRIVAKVPIVIDFGATFDGYRSDMTRTICVGAPDDPELCRMLEVVSASQQAGVDLVKAGVKAAEVDRACREVIEKAGWGEAFSHSTGHGVGLDVHEAPWVASSSEEVLKAGSVVTVEPGVYVAGLGGVRIEDTVVVTTSGCEAVTRYPRECIIA